MLVLQLNSPSILLIDIFTIRDYSTTNFKQKYKYKTGTSSDETHQMFSFSPNPVPSSPDQKNHWAPKKLQAFLSGGIKDTVKLQLVLWKEEYACGSFVLLCFVMISQTCMTLRRIWRLMRDRSDKDKASSLLSWMVHYLFSLRQKLQVWVRPIRNYTYLATCIFFLLLFHFQN